jgi:quercetin dioxygenase-like cupin family protein
LSPDTPTPPSSALQFDSAADQLVVSTAEIFVGTVHTSQIGPLPGGGEGRAAYIRFGPGAHTRVHTHAHEQLLIIVDGEGHVGEPGADRVVRAGDVVRIPAGRPHYHGAGAATSMTHVAVLSGTTSILDTALSWPPA